MSVPRGMHLRPHAGLFLRRILGSLLAVTLFGYLWQGLVERDWWTADYVVSLAIPFTIFPSIVWVMFVPQELDISDHHMMIRFPFRTPKRFDWNDLKYWGGAEAVFLLQFNHSQTLQIAIFAFPKDQRRQFKIFVKERFPHRKARGWFGTRGFG